jgi:ATP-dependent exoDNAse (exonuclease V) alpha subunit
MLFGQIYRNKLAKNIKKLGYKIEVTNPKQGLWELKNFNKELLKEFSTRRFQLREKLLELKVKYPNLSDAKLKEMAALRSRKIKDKNIDREKVRKINIQRAIKILEKEKLHPKMADDKALMPNSQQQGLTKEEVLKIAEDILTSKESIFSKEKLYLECLKLSIESYTLEDIQKAIQKDSNLVYLENNLYTTKEMINIEKGIVKNIKNSKPIKEITTTKRARDYINLFYKNFTEGQKSAFTHIVTSKDRIIGIQGDAGSGKTYMLQALEQFNLIKFNLKGLAFTGKAAQQLETESGIKSDTLHSFLIQKNFEPNQVYIVDEASMIGSKQFNELQNIAVNTNSKIVLIGDTKQFQTIQAGSIFLELEKRQLIKTAYMSENRRAKTKLLKNIYQNIKNKDIDQAFDLLNKNSLLKETNNLEQIKNDYLKDKDDTLLIVSKNKDRQNLNKVIREELKHHISNSQSIKIRENTALDDTERHYAINYSKGQMVFIQKPTPGLKAGTEAFIQEVNQQKNILTLKTADQKEIMVSLLKHGGNLASFDIKDREFGVGDKIIFTKNDRKLKIKNGQTGIIKKISNKQITVQKEDSSKITINLDTYNYLDYGYAITDYKSQGQTSKKVIVFTDSNMANMNSFYVQVTRAKEELNIYTDDIDNLRDRVKAQQVKTSTLDYFYDENNISEKLDEADKFVRRRR